MPAKSAGQDIEPVYVIFTRAGQPYTSEGFKALQGKLMRAWGKAGNARFTFHDAGRAHGITKLRKEDRKSTRLNSSHIQKSRMPSSA